MNLTRLCCIVNSRYQFCSLIIDLVLLPVSMQVTRENYTLSSPFFHPKILLIITFSGTALGILASSRSMAWPTWVFPW